MEASLHPHLPGFPHEQPHAWPAGIAQEEAALGEQVTRALVSERVES